MENKIKDKQALLPIRQQARKESKVVVFTNGVFDLLHRGHVEYLQKARELGDMLIVGLNSDASVHAIKGPKRPLVRQEDRATVLAALACVDYIVYFDEETPAELIEAIMPDILVKGADYSIEQIVGAETVLKNGGQVISIELTPGRSTSELIKKIVDVYSDQKKHHG
jgi:D-beta-D-heptose 7-phosphate kinase/D-beta-D-heptose 1-phosphate adenosyltransferase